MTSNPSSEKKSSLIYLLGVLMIVTSSIWKYLSTGSYQVDNNPILGWEMYPIVLLFISGFLLNGYAYYQLVKTPNVSKKSIIKLGVITVVMAGFMIPMLSNDMTLYMAYGDLATQGTMAYTNGDVLNQSSFFEQISFHWADCPNHYGPPLLSVFTLSVFIGKTLTGSLIVFKIFQVLFGIAFIFTMAKISDFFENKSFNGFALVALAPVFWLQGIGQMHVDNIIMLFIALSLLLILQKKEVFASVFIALIVLSKSLYAVVFIPLLLYFIWLNRGFSFKETIPKAIGSLAIIAVIVVGFYGPIWEGMETITATTTYHENKGPSKSHVEIVSDIVFYANEYFTQNNDQALDNVAVNNAANDAKKLGIWKTVTPIFKLFGVLVGLWVGIGVFYVKETKEALHIFGKLLIVVVCFYSPIFHPWYFLLSLPFFVFAQKESWIKYVVLVFTFSSLHEVMFAIPRDEPFYFIVIPLIFLTVASFFLYFKRHFFFETLELMRKKKFVLKQS